MVSEPAEDCNLVGMRGINQKLVDWSILTTYVILCCQWVVTTVYSSGQR